MPTKLTTNGFIERARNVHGDRYDYSQAIYTDMEHKLIVVCPAHGPWPVKAKKHIFGKNGCPQCGHDKIRVGLDEFIRRSKEVHGDRYDYSRIESLPLIKGRVTVICPEHGEWRTKAQNHINGRGCPKCADQKNGDRCRMTQQAFIDLCREKHGDKYDYSAVVYIGMERKVTVICPEHGPWELLAANHAHSSHGCPVCNESKGENKVAQWLDEKGIRYERQKRFKDCRDKLPLPFDFYLPDHNVLIEYNGAQHYTIATGYFRGRFGQQLRRDYIKSQWAKENGYLLICIRYDQDVREILDSRYVERG